MVSTELAVFPYKVEPSHILEETTIALATQNLPKLCFPISLHSGRIYIQHKEGSIDSIPLQARGCETRVDDLIQSFEIEMECSQAELCFRQLLKCSCRKDALRLALAYQQLPWIEEIGKFKFRGFHESIRFKAEHVWNIWTSVWPWKPSDLARSPKWY